MHYKIKLSIFVFPNTLSIRNITYKITHSAKGEPTGQRLTMKQRTIKYNFAFNLANTVAGLLFPLITFPYVSRILSPDGIGIVQFYQSIISYITLFTSLGIPLYAVREVARFRNNERERNKVTTEVLCLHLILSFIGYVAVAVLCLYVGRVRENLPLFLLISSSIGFTVIGVSWFYQGVEDFKYITIRSLITRTLAAVFLFLLVHNKSDLLTYAAIYVMADVGSNLFNFFRLRKYIRHDEIKLSEMEIKRHLKPTLKIFMLNIITSIYIQLDSVMLGFMTDNAAVGYYSSATKLTRILIGIITSLSTVLLPRMSTYIEEGKLDEFQKIGKKSIDFVIVISIPMAVGLLLVAHPLTILFAGEGFEPAALTTQIISPIVFIVCLASILGMYLYSQNKEHLIIIATLCGASVNLILNSILIPLYQQNGAAFSTLIAETIVTSIIAILGRKYIHYNFFNFITARTVLFTSIMAIGIIIIDMFMPIENTIIKLVTLISTGITIYAVLLIINKDEYANIIIDKIKGSIPHNKH